MSEQGQKLTDLKSDGMCISDECHNCGAYQSELASLRAEVERLRAENEQLQKDFSDYVQDIYNNGG